ncbi:MAG: DUF2782 domain-containing protein [Pseudomonadota bacterium]
MRRALFIALLLAGTAHAAQKAPPPGTEALPELQVENRDDTPPAGSEVPPELQVAPQEGEASSPEVTIKRDAKGTREEYSVNGRVYMVKVIPAIGPAYYLVDPTGQGEFSQQINDIKNPPPVPRWVLLRW